MNIDAVEKRYLANEALKSDVQTQQLYDALESINDNDLLSTTLDSSYLLVELENKLKGRIQVWDDNKQSLEWQQLTAPVMNDEGINAVLQEVMVRTGRDMILANLDANEVRSRMKRLIINVTCMIMAKSNSFGIDRVRRSNVCDMIYSIVHNHMTRSIGRAEGRDVYGRTKAIEHLQRSFADKESKGAFGLFGGKA